MNKLRNKQLLLNSMVLFLVFFTCSCNKVKQDDIGGTYVANYDIAKETLILDKDGKFKQEVFLKSNSKIDTQSGTWSYSKEKNAITFYGNFMSVKDGYDKVNKDYSHPGAGLTILPVTNFMGSIQIEIYEGIFLKKVKS